MPLRTICPEEYYVYRGNSNFAQNILPQVTYLSSSTACEIWKVRLMRTSTHIKLATCFFLLFIIAVDPGLLMPARVKTYAATTKTGSCGTWNLVPSPNIGGLS